MGTPAGAGSDSEPRRVRTRSLLLAAVLLGAVVASLLAAPLGAGAHPAAPRQHRAAEPSTTPHVAVVFSCTEVTFTYADFRDGKENTVLQKVKSDGTILYKEKFTFDGSSGSDSVKIPLTAGTHLLKAEAIWKTNGLNGETGPRKERITCTVPKAAYTIEKLQAIAGSGVPPTAAPITNAKVGQTVDYEIIVSNTGNIPLVLSGFSDPNCDHETLGGGQGESPLGPGASTTYTCIHVISEGGSYSNVASITAALEGGADPMSQSSNTVTVTAAGKPHFEMEKLQKIAGSAPAFTSALIDGTVGQTVDYEIVVKNSGNVPLTFSEFTDIYCDSGTIAGGPAGALAPGEHATYTCSHVLSEPGPYYNVASVTATTSGFRMVEASNLVTVKVSAANVATGTTPGTTPTSGVLPTSTSASGKPTGSGGVLSAKAKKKKKARRTTAHKTPKFTG